MFSSLLLLNKCSLVPFWFYLICTKPTDFKEWNIAQAYCACFYKQIFLAEANVKLFKDNADFLNGLWLSPLLRWNLFFWLYLKNIVYFNYNYLFLFGISTLSSIVINTEINKYIKIASVIKYGKRNVAIFIILYIVYLVKTSIKK